MCINGGVLFHLVLHRGLALSPLVAWSDKESHSRDYDAYTFLSAVFVYMWAKEPLDMGIEEIRRVTSVLSSHMVNSALPRTLFPAVNIGRPKFLSSSKDNSMPEATDNPFPPQNCGLDLRVNMTRETWSSTQL